MSPHTDSDRIEDMLDACEKAAEFDDLDTPSTPRRRTFTKWERDFLESVRDQWDDRGTLSARQEEILTDLYDKT